MSEENLLSTAESDTLEAAKNAATSEGMAAPTVAQEVVVNAAHESAHAHDEPAVGAPADIARRVDALAETDQLEQLARAEEEQLAARRAAAAETGIEAAATRKLEAIGTKLKKKKLAKDQRTASAGADGEGNDADGEYEPVAPPQEPLHDAFLDGSRGAMEWVKSHSQVVWGAAGVATLIIVGFGVMKQMAAAQDTKASVVLAEALEINSAPVMATVPEDTDMKTFTTAALRRDAALSKFGEVISSYPSTGAAILAELSQASLLADKGDKDASLASYNKVRNSTLAAMDARVKAQATEGAAQVKEAKGDSEGAFALYKELEGLTAAGAKETGEYHQARLLEKKGDKDGAKALYLKARDSIGNSKAFAFLSTAVDDHLRAIDPSLVPTKKPGGMGGGPQGLPEGMDLEALMAGQGQGHP